MKILIETAEDSFDHITSALDALSGSISLQDLQMARNGKVIKTVVHRFGVSTATLYDPNTKPIYKERIVKVACCPRCGGELEEVKDRDAATMMAYICSRNCGYAY